MGGWNWLDWTLTAVAVASVATAALKGFIQELISLASLAAGLVIAALGYGRAANWVEDLTRSRTVALGAGFLILFLGTLVLGALVALAANELIRKSGLRAIDRFLGGAFGLIRGAIVDSVLLMIMVSFAIKPEALQQSLLAPYVVTGARVISLVMPGSVQDEFHAGFKKFRQALIEKDKRAGQN